MYDLAQGVNMPLVAIQTPTIRVTQKLGRSAASTFTSSGTLTIS